MNIKFNSEQLTNYIGFKLDVLDNEFTQEQLNSLTTPVLLPGESQGQGSLVGSHSQTRLKRLSSILAL